MTDILNNSLTSEQIEDDDSAETGETFLGRLKAEEDQRSRKFSDTEESLHPYGTDTASNSVARDAMERSVNGLLDSSSNDLKDHESYEYERNLAKMKREGLATNLTGSPEDSFQRNVNRLYGKTAMSVGKMKPGYKYQGHWSPLNPSGKNPAYEEITREELDANLSKILDPRPGNDAQERELKDNEAQKKAQRINTGIEINDILIQEGLTITLDRYNDLVSRTGLPEDNPMIKALRLKVE